MTFEQQIRAAEGYVELGMPAEALAHLNEIPVEDQDRPEALRMRIQIVLQIRDWQTALELSLRMCELFPLESYGFIHAGFCLHELGQTAKAKEKLLGGPPSLLDEPIYYYNLGCYEAVLGNLDQAKAYLRASFRLNKTFRDIAQKDPDLAPIRDDL
jgi:tetratricopeptide (TPR) repeat protein